MIPRIVLASSSPFRRMLLANAGVSFTWQAADIDERAIEASLEGSDADPCAVALVLAEAKAKAVSDHLGKPDKRNESPAALVIGSDQTLSLGDRVFHKPASLAEAQAHLTALAGKTHALNSAIVLYQEGKVLWSHLATARLTMRSLTPDFITRHLERVGEKALTSVGAYQLEGEGVQLFEAIDGDYFTILGLPLLPLLAQLRLIKVIDA